MSKRTRKQGDWNEVLQPVSIRRPRVGRHCQSVHVAPDCTEGACIHMMEDAQAREYLSEHYPGAVHSWRTWLEEEARASVDRISETTHEREEE